MTADHSDRRATAARYTAAAAVCAVAIVATVPYAEYQLAGRGRITLVVTCLLILLVAAWIHVRHFDPTVRGLAVGLALGAAAAGAFGLPAFVPDLDHRSHGLFPVLGLTGLCSLYPLVSRDNPMHVAGFGIAPLASLWYGLAPTSSAGFGPTATSRWSRSVPASSSPFR